MLHPPRASLAKKLQSAREMRLAWNGSCWNSDRHEGERKSPVKTKFLFTKLLPFFNKYNEIFRNQEYLISLETSLGYYHHEIHTFRYHLLDNEFTTLTYNLDINVS